MTSCCASLKLRQTCPMSGQILNAICTPEVPHRIQLKLEFCLKLYCCLASFLFPVLLPPSFSPEGTFIINDLNIEPLHRLCCSEPGPSQHWTPLESMSFSLRFSHMGLGGRKLVRMSLKLTHRKLGRQPWKATVSTSVIWRHLRNFQGVLEIEAVVQIVYSTLAICTKKISTNIIQTEEPSNAKGPLHGKQQLLQTSYIISGVHSHSHEFFMAQPHLLLTSSKHFCLWKLNAHRLFITHPGNSACLDG